ncbi:MAG: glycoside hydrolase family 13 protein, partial [Oscillospiraceae bacterium]|nr:glycoside hydrolase family 13 protein [Oscillospiraceae bacterium]
MSQPIYNSRDTRYKTPYGAVPSGTKVRLTLRPERTRGFSYARLTARFEMDSGREVLVPMPWKGTQLGVDEFSAVLDTGDYVGLVWYSFVLEGLDGRRQELGEYQLTVYDRNERVPGWFGEGVCYQIFPDRFFRTRVPDPTGMVGGRTVHMDWEEEPEYRPDETGEVRNRDFFGGNLAGITEKLDYIASLGVETVYLCPIFEAAENHRYGTADYGRIDPMLGTNKDFKTLCDQLHKRGMRLMLDGVFNHTGYVSRYFNGDGFYPDPGACQSEDSPYRSWFQFKHWPDKYESWWGIYSLPAVNEDDPSYRDFIFGGKDSVVRRWLRAGADGWRLDVADELPDDFVHGIHAAARAEKPEAVVIGEVWEDGTTKIAYDVRRKHLLGGHCDGLMNYPFRTAVLDWLRGGDASDFVERMETLRENYPPYAFYSAMNALGTHDSLRVLTLLGVGEDKCGQSK